jgi:hypothetical protein
MMRIFLLLACFFAFPTGYVSVTHAQAGFDRPGGDYANAPVRGGDPAVCAARCERDGRCRAWSFSYPRTVSREAICWLKSEVTPSKEADCCISGVRGAGVIEPRTGSLEFSIDRIGGDYRNFEITPDPTGKSCASACEADSRCRAFPDARPGDVGSSARCYQKDKITRPRRKPCCISGVVR